MQSVDKTCTCNCNCSKVKAGQINIPLPHFFTLCIKQCVMGLLVGMCSLLLDFTVGVMELAELPESKVCWDSLAPLQRSVMPNVTDFKLGRYCRSLFLFPCCTCFVCSGCAENWGSTSCGHPAVKLQEWNLERFSQTALEVTETHKEYQSNGMSRPAEYCLLWLFMLCLTALDIAVLDPAPALEQNIFDFSSV